VVGPLVPSKEDVVGDRPILDREAFSSFSKASSGKIFTNLDIGEMLRLLYLAVFNFHSMEGGNSGGDGGGLVQRLYPFMFFGGWWRRRSKSVRAAICCLDINHASENGVESFRVDHRFFTSGNVEASVKTPRT